MVEAAIALTIIGLSATGALAALAAHSRTAAQAEARAVAQSLARDVLTRLQLLQLDGSSPIPDTLARGRFPEPFADHEWRAFATSTADRPRLVHLRVHVIGDGANFEIRTTNFIRTPAHPLR